MINWKKILKTVFQDKQQQDFLFFTNRNTHKQKENESISMCYWLTYSIMRCLTNGKHEQKICDEDGNLISINSADDTDKAKAVQKTATRVVMFLLMFLFVCTNVVFTTAVEAPICSFSFEQFDLVVVSLHDIHYCERAGAVDEEWGSWKKCPSNLNASYNFTDRYECPAMQSTISATTIIMTTTLWLYTAVLAMFSVFVVLSLLQSLLALRKDMCCRSVKIFFKRISSFLTAILTLLLCAVPLFSVLLSVPAFLTISLSLSRLCRSANDGMFVRPLYHRRNFEFGSGTKLVIAGAVLCWIATIAAVIVLVKARHRVVAITIGNLTGDDFEELMSDDDEEDDDFDEYVKKQIQQQLTIADQGDRHVAVVVASSTKKRRTKLEAEDVVDGKKANDDDGEEVVTNDGNLRVTIDGVEKTIRLRH